jgi:hypothetical protein
MSVTMRQASSSDLPFVGELGRHVSADVLPDVVCAGLVVAPFQSATAREVWA